MSVCMRKAPIARESTLVCAGGRFQRGFHSRHIGAIYVCELPPESVLIADSIPSTYGLSADQAAGIG